MLQDLGVLEQVLICLAVEKAKLRIDKKLKDSVPSMQDESNILLVRAAVDSLVKLFTKSI